MAYPRWLVTGILLSIQSPIQALELGELELISQLHQPFQAEVPFYLEDAENIKRIKIALASHAQMAEAGISGHNNLPSIQAQRIGSVIKLSSQQVLNDPWLDFVLDIYDGKQHLFQKYNLHLGSDGVAATVSGQALKLKTKADTTQESARKPSISKQDTRAAKADLKTEQAPVLSKTPEPAKQEVQAIPASAELGKTIALQDSVPPKHEHSSPSKAAENTPAQLQNPVPAIPDTLVASIHENTQKLIEQSFNSMQQRTEQLQQQINTVQAQQQQMLESSQAQHENLNLLSMLAMGSLLLGLVNLGWAAFRLKASAKAEPAEKILAPKTTPKKPLEEPKPKPIISAMEIPETEAGVVYTPSKPIKKREEPVLDLAAALLESDKRFASVMQVSTSKPAAPTATPLQTVKAEPDFSPAPKLESDVFDFDFSKPELTSVSPVEVQTVADLNLDDKAGPDQPKTKKSKSSAKKKPADAGSSSESEPDV